MIRHPAATLVLVALIGIGIWGLLIWRAHTTSLTTDRLCTVIGEIIAAGDRTLGKPGSSGYRYYHANPDELQAAHRRNQATLRQLPCTLKETP